MSRNGSADDPPWLAAPADDAAAVAPVQAPVVLLYVALAVGVAGLLTIPLRPLPVHVAGYLLSAFGCVGLLATYSHLDSNAKATRLYLVTPWVPALQRGTAVVALLAAMGHVWQLATWLAS